MYGSETGTVDVVVDHYGRVWNASAVELAKHHHAIETQDDLAAYLVRNCGYVRLQWSSLETTAVVSFRLGYVATKTIERIIELVIYFDAEHISIDSLGEDSSLYLADSIDDLAFVLAEQSFGQYCLKRPRFFIQPLSIERLFMGDELKTLRRRYQSWRKSKAVLEELRDDQELIDTGGSEYAARLGPNAAIFHELGTGFSRHGTHYGRHIGQDIHEQPDQDYGAWVSEALLRVGTAKKPALEMVEATIALSDGPPMRFRYQRLMLPWSSRMGSLVSSASIVRLSVPSTS